MEDPVRSVSSVLPIVSRYKEKTNTEAKNAGDCRTSTQKRPKRHRISLQNELKRELQQYNMICLIAVNKQLAKSNERNMSPQNPLQELPSTTASFVPAYLLRTSSHLSSLTSQTSHTLLCPLCSHSTHVTNPILPQNEHSPTNSEQLLT